MKPILTVLALLLATGCCKPRTVPVEVKIPIPVPCQHPPPPPLPKLRTAALRPDASLEEVIQAYVADLAALLGWAEAIQALERKTLDDSNPTQNTKCVGFDSQSRAELANGLIEEVK